MKLAGTSLQDHNPPNQPSTAYPALDAGTGMSDGINTSEEENVEWGVIGDCLGQV